MSFSLVESRSPIRSISAFASSINDSFASTPAVGSLVVVTGGGGGTGTTYTVADNQGNTYTVLQTSNAKNYSTFVAYCKVATSSGTFTVTVTNGAQKDNIMQISNWTGNDATTVVDLSTIGSEVIDAAVSVSTSGATAAAGELIVSVFGCETQTLTLTADPSGFTTNLFREDATTGAWTRGAWAGSYKIGSSPTTETAAWPNNTTSGFWGQSALIVAFKVQLVTANSDGWPIGGNVAVGMLLATGGGGGGTTITTMTGDASALGTTALVNVTIQTTTGNSSALGTTANVSRTIQTTTGNASALGTTALVSPTIQTTTGNASALGTTALISRTIQTTTGDASALGITASISSATNTTITCTVGDASALGVTARVSPTIQTTTGNASALGTTALLNTSVQTTTGNTAATGTTALVSPTIQTTTGNASALGTTALLNTTIQTTTGNASALGITASVGSGSNTTITTTTGDVSALGTTALVNVTIQTSTGNAAAAGTTSLVNATTQTTAGNAAATGTTSLVNVTIQTTTGNAAALGVTAAIVQPGAVVIPTITGDAAAQGVTANITFTEAPSGRRPRSLRLIHDVRVYPSKVQARVQARGVIVRATNPPPAAAPEFVFAPVVAPSPPPPPVSVHAAVMMPRAKATCSARGVSTRIGACATVSGVRGTGRQGVISAAASTRAALQSFRVTTHVNDPDEVWGEQNDDADALFDTILTIID